MIILTKYPIGSLFKTKHGDICVLCDIYSDHACCFVVRDDGLHVRKNYRFDGICISASYHSEKMGPSNYDITEVIGKTSYLKLDVAYKELKKECSVLKSKIYLYNHLPWYKKLFKFSL